MTLEEYKKLPKPNKKIKGARKSEQDGIKFDSQLEKYMYNLLKASGIEFEFQKVFVLQPGFRYRGEAIRPIKSIVDFWLPAFNVIIDTKGFSTKDSLIKFKLLKRYLWENGPVDPTDCFPEIIMPKNKKECELTLNKILYKQAS
jgi:hypothetical protein